MPGCAYDGKLGSTAFDAQMAGFTTSALDGIRASLSLARSPGNRSLLPGSYWSARLDSMLLSGPPSRPERNLADRDGAASASTRSPTPPASSGAIERVRSQGPHAFRGREQEQSPAKRKAGLSLLLTLRGISQMHSGDEIAMAGGADPTTGTTFPQVFPANPLNPFTAGGRTPEQQDVSASRKPAIAHWPGHTYFAFLRETPGTGNLFRLVGPPPRCHKTGKTVRHE